MLTVVTPATAAALPAGTNATAAVLFSGVADVEGFRHADLGAFPPTKLSPTVPSQSTTGIDVCAADANVVARVRGNQVRRHHKQHAAY